MLNDGNNWTKSKKNVKLLFITYIKKEVSNVASLYDCSKALDYCRDFFVGSFAEFKIVSVVLFGSATYPGCFRFDTSDLDILVLTSSSLDDLELISQTIEQRMVFNDSHKRPVVIRDQIGARIEFLLPYDGIAVDCTIMPTLLPNRGSLMKTAVYDSSDLLMGAIVEHGVVIAGDKARLKEIGNQYEPYYDDELRMRRLSVLANYLEPKTLRIRELLRDGNPEVVDYFFRYRAIFLKYIFCYYRKYPVNYHKHLNYQANEILHLAKKDRDIFLLSSSDNWRDSISDFIEMYERCSSCGQ